MGRSLSAEFPASRRQKDLLASLTRSDAIDYACGLLGPMQRLAEQRGLDLLAHLASLAYAEACWQRDR